MIKYRRFADKNGLAPFVDVFPCYLNFHQLIFNLELSKENKIIARSYHQILVEIESEFFEYWDNNYGYIPIYELFLAQQVKLEDELPDWLK